MTVADLLKVLAKLPPDMDVRMFPSVVDECHVHVCEIYAAHPLAKDQRATLMLLDKRQDDYGGTIVFDETE